MTSDWDIKIARSVLTVSENSTTINPCNYDFRKIPQEVLHDFFRVEEDFNKFCDFHDLVIGFDICDWGTKKRKRGRTEEGEPPSDRGRKRARVPYSPPQPPPQPSEKGEIERELDCLLDGVTNHVFSLLNSPNTTVEFNVKVTRNDRPFERPFGRWTKGKTFSDRHGTYI